MGSDFPLELIIDEDQVCLRRSLSWRPRPPTWRHSGQQRNDHPARGGGCTYFSLPWFLSHICQHDPNTDESRADMAAETDGKVTLGRPKESVRGKTGKNDNAGRGSAVVSFYHHD